MCGLCVCSGLTIHRRIHTGGKPFECEYCERKFSAPRCVSVIALSLKLFFCAFYVHSSLRYHRLKHTVGKAFQCDCCDKSFLVLRYFKDALMNILHDY